MGHCQRIGWKRANELAEWFGTSPEPSFGSISAPEASVLFRFKAEFAALPRLLCPGRGMVGGTVGDVSGMGTPCAKHVDGVWGRARFRTSIFFSPGDGLSRGNLVRV